MICSTYPQHVLVGAEADVRHRLEHLVLHVGVEDGVPGGVLVHLHPVAEGDGQKAAMAELEARGSGPELEDYFHPNMNPCFVLTH